MSVPSLQQGHSAPGLPTASQGKPGGLAELKPEGLRSRQDSGGERCHLGQGRRMTEQNSNYGHLHEIKCEGGNRPEQKVHSCQTWRLLTTTPVLERLRGRRIVIGLRPACQIPSPSNKTLKRLNKLICRLKCTPFPNSKESCNTTTSLKKTCLQVYTLEERAGETGRGKDWP